MLTPPGRTGWQRHPLGGTYASPVTPWQAYVVRQLVQALADGDLPTFANCLSSEPAVLGEDWVRFQVQILEQAAVENRGAFIAHLIECEPALLRHAAPPPSEALTHALAYGHAHLLPLLTRIWPLPGDLPHAAGAGDLAAVKRWFDERGEPALGELKRHYPADCPAVRRDLNWGEATVQQVLDVALAWASMNHHFEIAAFLLEHGANINTNWATHEPASLLHEAAIRADYPVVRFLLERGIDTTLRDHRWNATAEGWACHAGSDPQMAALLANHPLPGRPGSPS